MAAAVSRRIDPSSELEAAERLADSSVSGSRVDPPARPTDGTKRFSSDIQNVDSDRHYVGVYEGDAQNGVQWYQSRGYRIEILREGGPRFRGGLTSKVGEPVSYRGHILMSISRAEKVELDAHGEDGASGQAEFDDLMQQIVSYKKTLVGTKKLSGERGVTYATVHGEN